MSKLNITRRDFLGGVAMSVAAGSALSPLELLAKDGRYPPALTGIRGSTPGSFEVAHALAWGNTRWPRPEERTDDEYDLVVVGGGLSGLSAALMYRQRVGSDPKILILDNHEDFGGHATRNEFTVDGKKLISYGGSQSIDSPATYSAAAAQVLKDIGVYTEPFYQYFDSEFFSSRQMQSGVYFSAKKYGVDSVQPNVLRGGAADEEELRSIIDKYPISEDARASFIKLLTAEDDYLAGKSADEKLSSLRSVSYSDYLRTLVGTHEEVVLILRDMLKGYWGVGLDALSANEGRRLGLPGTWYLGLPEESSGPTAREEPYIFHFPDGNAGVARALVNKLVPNAIPGQTMEDLVLARADYEQLDLPGNSTRIRLDSTVVDVRHANGDRVVDVTYVSNGTAHRVRGKHAILACYNRVIPFICPDVPKSQADAIGVNEKIPLVYISIAVRNWQAFHNTGYRQFYVPQPEMMQSFGMDFPVSMGGYEYTKNPDEPTVVHGSYVPTAPDQGLTAREQNVAGRRKLLELSFADFERQIISDMSGALSSGGFDADRDIAAITVNRWPHGYAWEYNDLYDPPDWSPANGPHIAGAKQIGRISIANSDASAFAFVNGAFDAADRAVNEQLAES